MTKHEQAGLRAKIRRIVLSDTPDVFLSDNMIAKPDEILALFESTCLEVINQSHPIFLTKDDNGVVDMQDDVVAHWERLRVLQRQALAKLLGRGEEG